MNPASVGLYAYRFHKFHKSRIDNEEMANLRGSNKSTVSNVSKYISPLDYRIRKIERSLNAFRPELKAFQKFGVVTVAPTDFGWIPITSDIVQGDDEFNRTGNAIRIKGIKITVNKTGGLLAAWLNLSPNGIFPSGPMFTNSAIPQVLIQESDDQKILRYIHNFNSLNGQEVVMNRKFKKPLHTKYRLPNGICESENMLNIGLRNNGGGNHSFEYALTVYFYDA